MRLFNLLISIIIAECIRNSGREIGILSGPLNIISHLIKYLSNKSFTIIMCTTLRMLNTKENKIFHWLTYWQTFSTNKSFPARAYEIKFDNWDFHLSPSAALMTATANAHIYLFAGQKKFFFFFFRICRFFFFLSEYFCSERND